MANREYTNAVGRRKETTALSLLVSLSLSGYLMRHTVKSKLQKKLIKPYENVLLMTPMAVKVLLIKIGNAWTCWRKRLGMQLKLSLS